MKTIIIYENEDRTISALKENGEIVELYEESKDIKKQEGNIYCGIIRDIIPGMQSAFIDINESKNAFIHIKDILPKASNETGNRDEKFEDYDIRKYIKEGDTILVQAKKDGEGKKGARVSKHISLTGKYLVLMPESDFITVSQKIDEKDKEDLKNKVKAIVKSEIKNEKYGIIIRTSAQGINENYIREDLKELIKSYKGILRKYETKRKERKAGKLYDGYSTTKKLIIGIINNGCCEIIVNQKDKYEELEQLLNEIENKEVYLKLENKNLLEEYSLDIELEKLQERKIWLKCGGFITIDKTEALTAIDVNSGKFVGSKKKSNKEETLLRVNKEATIEIAKQLRLKNIGGIIVIDYIDMEQEEDRKELIDMLRKEAKKDRAKIQIVGFTKLDLLELTRKKL